MWTETTREKYERNTGRYASDLTDGEWKLIEPFLPLPRKIGRPRRFAAWLGLTPRANSSGGKARLGGISKMGDQYLRRLLVNGMTSQLRWVRLHPDAHPWAAGLLRRKPAKLVAVAMANKAARIAWVVMTRDEIYGAPQPSTREAAA